MALNHRLTIVGSDVNNNNLEVLVYLNNYAGSPVTREGTGEVLTVEYGADSKQLPLIYGSAATVRFWALTDYEFMDLFATTSRDVYVVITINSLLFWAGYIEPEKWGEPLISAPYEVSLTAYDGLGLLKDEDFLNPDKTTITGNLTPREILQLILAKTGLSLPLNTAVNIRPTTELSINNALDQYKINVENYTGLSCYEVLEQLFKNCRIMQRGGEWVVIANNLLKNETVTFFRYDATGTSTGTGTKNLRLTGFTFEDEPNLEMAAALKQLTIKHDYGYIENVINNADFSEFKDGIFTHWSATGVTPEQRNYDNEGDKYIYIPGYEYSDPWEEAARTKYMKSAAIPVTISADTFNLKFKFALMGNTGKSAKMFVGALITGTAVNHILEAYVDSEHTVKYRWIAVSTGTTTAWPVPVKSYIKHKNPFPWFTSDSWELRAENVEAHPVTEITDHFEEISINPDGGIPATGNLYIFLYVPNNNAAGIAGACFDVISLFITDANAEEYATATQLTIINNLANNYTPDDVTLLNGDSPDIPNRQTIYRGGFMLAADDTPTNTWTIDGSGAAYSYAELTARLLASETRSIKQTYRARLANATPGFGMVFEDTDNSNTGRYFVEVAQTFDFVMNAIDGRFVELLTVSLDTFSTVANAEFTKPASSGGTSSNFNPTPATDEKVKLINPYSYTPIGQPGYLSAQYFEQDIDDTTGRALIRPRMHIEAGTITNITSTPVQIIFTNEYPEAPSQVTLKVYRYFSIDTGKYVIQNVLHYFAETPHVTTIGVDIYIDPSESLEGVIIEYCFIK